MPGFFLYFKVVKFLSQNITAHLQSLAAVAFPNTCALCSSALQSGEQDVCRSCMDTLPQTDYYAMAPNPITERLLGRLQLVHAAAYLHVYEDNLTTKLLHLLKYKGKQRIGVMLGRQFGNKLIQQQSFIKNIDLIIPVPLHPKRERERGYNQSRCFAQGISEELCVPYNSKVVTRIRYTQSQTGLSRYERWQNVDGVFALQNADAIAGKHILLVDDVITTGATIEACALALLAANNVRLSIVTIAAARV